MRWRLQQLPPAARVAVAGFLILVLGMHLAAQATIWATVGGGSFPGPDQVRGKYHGRPDRSRLHEVLDLSLPSGDPRAMYWYLDSTSSPDDLGQIEARRAEVLAWVEAGAPEGGWADVRRVLHDEAMCLECHGFGGEQHRDAPLETYEEVKPFAEPGRGIGLRTLLVSAHNHVFAFAVLVLLLGLGVAFTALPRGLQVGLVSGAALGAALDVGCWFLTRAHGTPFEYGVMLGGALFGLSTGAMAVAVLDEVLLRGRLTACLPFRHRGSSRP